MTANRKEIGPGSYEYGNEILVSIKDGQFLE
jgi:hypothetical protein